MEYFYNKLTESIDLSMDANNSSTVTFSHLWGTLSYIVSRTQLLVGRLNEAGVPSAISFPDVSGHSPIATGMQWLESCKLAWLPLGIEPFEESIDTLAQIGIMHMREFVNDTRERLMFDRMSVIALQDKVRTLAEIADELDTATASARDQEATTRVVPEHRRWNGLLRIIGLDTATARATDPKATTRVARGHRRFSGFLRMIGEEPNNWIAKQRLQVLESMAPIYQGFIKYLSDAELELGSALQACAVLEESLLGEELAVRRGLRPSDWVWEQPRVLEKGAAALARKLKVWNREKKRFTEQIFSQR